MGVLLSWHRCKLVLWMGLQPNGAGRSWEEHALEHLGVSQTCFTVVAHVMPSSVPVNFVETCSEQDWEGLDSTGLASHHHLCHGMWALKQRS